MYLLAVVRVYKLYLLTYWIILTYDLTYEYVSGWPLTTTTAKTTKELHDRLLFLFWRSSDWHGCERRSASDYTVLTTCGCRSGWVCCSSSPAWRVSRVHLLRSLLLLVVTCMTRLAGPSATQSVARRHLHRSRRRYVQRLGIGRHRQ